MAAATACLAGCSSAPACVASCVADFTPTDVEPTNVLSALGLLCLSALFSGLTLGLMSLDIRQLEVTIAGGSKEQRAQAAKILPLRKRGNLLLCTLLLGNTIVNAGIAILTATFTGGIVGAIASTGFILIFGEVIPQSVCTRYGLAAGARTVELVQFIRLVLLPVAYPLSRMLDWALGEELGTIYSKTELKELFAMQAKRNQEDREEEVTSGTRNAVDVEAAGIQTLEATFMSGILSMSEKSTEQSASTGCTAAPHASLPHRMHSRAPRLALASSVPLPLALASRSPPPSCLCLPSPLRDPHISHPICAQS